MVLFFLTSCSDPHWHNKEVVFLAEESYRILVDSGICNSLNECKAKEYIFARGRESSVSLYIYRVGGREGQASICEKLKLKIESAKYSFKVYIGFYGLPHGSDDNPIIFQCVVPGGNNESN